MGPVKAVIQGATAYAIAKKGLATYDKHETEKQNQARQQVQPTQHSQDQSRSPPAYNGQDFVHQAYCNGRCNYQCGGVSVNTKAGGTQ